MKHLKEQIKQVEETLRYIKELENVINTSKRTDIKISSNNGYAGIVIQETDKKLVQDVLMDIHARLCLSIEPLQNKLNTIEELIKE